MLIQTSSDVLLSIADDLLSRGDVAHASEKYYKAAEEAIKLLTINLGLKDILNTAKESGWDLATLHKAVTEICKKLNNEDIFEYWESAIVLLTVENLSLDVVKDEAENVRKLVKISDEIANRELDKRS